MSVCLYLGPSNLTMKRILLIQVLIMYTCFTACKKDNAPGGKTQESLPVKTEKGTVLGNPVSKTIGAAGGSLKSGDGKMTITVLPGTVPANTTFSIQPITCMLPGKENRPAYRLLPEGSAFAKNISLTYSYDSADIAGSAEELLTASYQTNEGKWKMVASSVNKTNHTVTLSTDHFSDWTVFGLIELKPVRLAVALHDTVDFLIEGFGTVFDELSYIGPDAGYSGSVNWVGDWKVIAGKGTVAPQKDNPLRATYRPPFPLENGSKAIVQVEAKGNIVIADSSFPGGKRSFKQMILRGEVSQVNDVFMMGSFMGQPIIATDVQATLTGEQLTINATMSTDSSSINYSVSVTGVDRPSLYPCGNIMEANVGEVRAVGTIKQQPIVYSTTYIKCGSPATAGYSLGGIHIKNLGPVGSYIAGSFEGSLYKTPDECSPPGKTLTIDFRAKRVW